MEYPKQFLGHFKNDYQSYGKFNLDVQVPHLVKLAGFYERRYKLTRNWTDCVKAHALYNSINRRQPQSLWEERVFEVQQEYWAGNSSSSPGQQQELTGSLKSEIESIREQCRYDMLAADELANRFDGSDTRSELTNNFFECMKRISLDYTDRMAVFAGRIIRESVDMLKPGKPPCDFVAVAIGSLARGEATPYSDLEFFFLIEHKTPAITKYFENLAITIYFQIGNLGESKLICMAVKELRGWFDDQAKNGFKIDGLTDQAGNIPTGNGSSHKRNHLIVTQNELVKRYRKILNEPDNEKALRGDLTAMLTYMKPIFASQAGKKDLFRKLQTLIRTNSINSLRRGVNLEMLQTDARKFNFRPSFELLSNGQNTYVKREIYRFPSILLLDINVIVQMYADSSWQSLKLLHERKHISAELQFVLRLLLSSAAYMRLSAYLHHDSQDDRMSVGQEIASSEPRTNCKYVRSQSTCRWFVPNGLYTHMCTKMISLKRKIAKSDGSKIMLDLKTLRFNDDDLWTNINTLFFTGRFSETLALLKRALGADFCHKPWSVTQIIPCGERSVEVFDIISITLDACHEFKAALVFNELIMTNPKLDRRIWIATCIAQLGNPRKAVDILQGVTTKSVDRYFHLGESYRMTKEYHKAEQSYIKALDQINSTTSSSEPLYDYYGDPIMTDELTDIDMSNKSLVGDLSPEERLSRVNTMSMSHDVIFCLIGLGSVYSDRAQSGLSNSYFKKALLLISELHGSEAAVLHAAQTFCSLGDNFYGTGHGAEALDYYKQALAVCKRLPQNTTNIISSHVITCIGWSLNARGRRGEAFDHYIKTLPLVKGLLKEASERSRGEILIDLGTIMVQLGRFREAEEHLKHALDIQKKLSQGAFNDRICRALHWLGETYNNLSRHGAALDCCKQALAALRRGSQVHPSTNRAIANELNSIGDIYFNMGQNTTAEYHYEQALIVNRKISQGTLSYDIGETLFMLGRNYIGVNDTKAIGALREAIHTTIRVDRDQHVNPNIIKAWDVLSLQLNHHHRI